MKNHPGLRRSILLTAFVAAIVACAQPKAPVAALPAPVPTTAPAQAVSAVVVANGCARLGKANAKMAEAAMNQLVDGCGSFRGAPVAFVAQLLPDGSIQFQPGPPAAPGTNETSAIPLCVLEHPLKHRVKLQAACSLDVRLEESTMQVPRAAGSGDGGL